MRLRRCLRVAVLVYIALDLSLASMPGAFVFEANDSVEGVQMNRAQDSAAAAIVLAFARDPRAVALLQESAVRRQVVPMPLIRRMSLRTGDRPVSAALETSPNSEDPH